MIVIFLWRNYSILDVLRFIGNYKFVTYENKTLSLILFFQTRVMSNEDKLHHDLPTWLSYYVFYFTCLSPVTPLFDSSE